jgi:hypothetical protein
VSLQPRGMMQASRWGAGSAVCKELGLVASATVEEDSRSGSSRSNLKK